MTTCHATARPYRAGWASDRASSLPAVITLRPLREDDVPLIYEACQDPLIPRFTQVPSPYTLEHARAALEPDGDEVRRAIAGAQDDRFLGLCGLLRFAPGGRSCEVGYWLAPWARGRGVVTRAVELLCAWG